MNSCLIGVDIQNDFCPGGALAVAEGGEVVKPFNSMKLLLERDGQYGDQNHQIVVTRDWHPQNSRHFDVNGGQWPVHCLAESVGAQFHPMLNIVGANILSKGVSPDEDGYSAFDGRLDQTGQTLEEFLRQHDVAYLYVCGLATDYCVKATALDGRRKGFQVNVVLDACRAVNLDPKDEVKAIREMVQARVQLVSQVTFEATFGW